MDNNFLTLVKKMAIAGFLIAGLAAFGVAQTSP